MMDGIIDEWKYYKDFIRDVKQERREVIARAINLKVVNAKDKVCTKSRASVDKFKKSIKDIDLKVKNGMLKVQENVNVKINDISQFYVNGVTNIKRNADKVKNYSRKKLNDFKLKKDKFVDKIIVTSVAVPIIIKNNVNLKVKNTISKIDRFKDRVITTSKAKVSKFKNGLSSVAKDVDLKVQNISSKVSEKVVLSEVKFCETANRFKGNVIRFSNNTKNKVCSVAINVKNKIKNTFVSDDATRENLRQEISDRKKKIAELKEYRDELLHPNNLDSVNVNRSRGNVYFLTLMTVSFIISLVSIITCILIKK